MLGDEGKVAVEQTVAQDVAQTVRANIAMIQDLDGNYLGGDNPNAAVSVEVGMPGHDVIWRGNQIAYLEFGTGSAGASSLYPGGAMGEAGYYPDPTKDKWVYLDRKTDEPTWSHGLAPQAPMYRASVAMRFGNPYAPAITALRRMVRDAIPA